MARWRKLILCVGTCLLAAGCPKTRQQYNAGQRAETLQDYDTAVEYYQKALATNPRDAQIRIKLNQARFEAGESHIKKGLALREKGDLQGAAAEFQHASSVDPSSPVALQELRRTLDLIKEQAHQQDSQAEEMAEIGGADLASAPPELKPLPNTSISLKMTNDVKIIFDTIGKLAGVTVTYDPDLPARRIPVDLSNLTLQQALDIVCMQSKTFWKPVTENIIFIAQDTTQKHKDYDEQLVETFYLANTVQSQDLTEIANGLRQVLNLTKVQQLNSQNAIIVRDTADKLAIARKLLKDIDKAKPEVVVQVEVLSASTSRLRDLGILPGQSAAITFTPPGTTTPAPTSGGTSTTPNSIPLKGFTFGAQDYAVTLPGATANFVLTDTTTKIIQNPEIRSVDGQPAKLNIGSRVPIATGSFQAGVGVGTTSVNPLVNTQFTYIDVGVNVNITPRVHPNHEVSLKVAIEVSQVTSFQSIGGIQQPVIGQNKIEHDIRLRDGEASILGGLFTKTDSKTVNGWPGLAQIPFLKYMFADNNRNTADDDVLIVLIPRIVRLPDWTRANLRPISSGAEQDIRTRRESDIRIPASAPTQQAPAPQAPAAQPPTPGAPSTGTQLPANQGEAAAQSARLRFDPQTLNLAPGQTATLGISVDNVNDLYSIPMILQFDPAVISIEDIQHGGFLSSGNQEIAIVQGGDKAHGQVMIAATRQPNTPGVSGSGTLLGIVVKALAPGNTNLSIVQVNAKDSQQKPLPLLTGDAVIQVKQP